MSFDTLKCIFRMAAKSIERLSRPGHECDRQTTDRPRCAEMCSNRRNHLHCKTRFCLIIYCVSVA